MKNSISKLILVCIGLVLGIILIFVVSEIYLRFKFTYIIKNEQKTKNLTTFDPEFLIQYTPKGRRLKPNVDVTIKNHYLSKKDIRIVTNSLGFRDTELEKIKKKNEIRILVLGDSITWGDYLEREKVFVEKLEKKLNGESDNYTFEAVNAGVGDIGLKEEIDILEEKGLSISPNIVIIAFYLNDTRPTFGFPGEAENKNFLRRYSLLIDRIYSEIELNSWLKRKNIDRSIWSKIWDSADWSHNKNDFMKLVKAANYDWGSAWMKSSWTDIREGFKKLRLSADKNNFKVVIVSFPVVFQIVSDFIEDSPQEKTAELAKEFNFGYLDLLPFLR